jgi:hypothetical protein
VGISYENLDGNLVNIFPTPNEIWGLLFGKINILPIRYCSLLAASSPIRSPPRRGRGRRTLSGSGLTFLGRATGHHP